PPAGLSGVPRPAAFGAGAAPRPLGQTPPAAQPRVAVQQPVQPAAQQRVGATPLMPAAPASSGAPPTSAPPTSVPPAGTGAAPAPAAPRPGPRPPYLLRPPPVQPVQPPPLPDPPPPSVPPAPVPPP